jgi:hypothetical protein
LTISKKKSVTRCCHPPAVDVDLVVPQNVVTIPMHFTVGIALTEIIAETQIPALVSSLIPAPLIDA